MTFIVSKKKKGGGIRGGQRTQWVTRTFSRKKRHSVDSRGSSVRRFRSQILTGKPIKTFNIDIRLESSLSTLFFVGRKTFRK